MTRPSVNDIPRILKYFEKKNVIMDLPFNPNFGASHFKPSFHNLSAFFFVIWDYFNFVPQCSLWGVYCKDWAHIANIQTRSIIIYIFNMCGSNRILLSRLILTYTRLIKIEYKYPKTHFFQRDMGS